jgi:hypothetical protein
VLSYVHADIVEAACTRISLTRDAVGPEGTIIDAEARATIAEALAALTHHVADGKAR